MKLILEGRAATETIMCMRDGMRQREGILARLKHSRCPGRLGELASAADSALHETGKTISQFWRGGDTDLQSVLDLQHGAFFRLAGEGWGTLELLREGCRYEPHLIADSSGVFRLMFYNPATGQYDLDKDRGWRGGGLPAFGSISRG